MSPATAPLSTQAKRILLGTALLLTLGMGMRQSFGLFLGPITKDLALTAADFTLALAIQNIVWGVSQAFVGALADRFGLRITMMAGAALYVVGLGIMAAAQGELALIVSGGAGRHRPVVHRDVTGHERVRSLGFGGASEHDARSRLRGRIDRDADRADRHAVSAGARAVADRHAVFRAAGRRDAAGGILVGRRRQDAGAEHGQTPRCAKSSARPCATGRSW